MVLVNTVRDGLNVSGEMEVKVTFEDFDLETIVEKAVTDEITRIVTGKVHSMLKDNNISFQSVSEQISLTVEREVTRILNDKNRDFNKMIERKIEGLVDKDIEGVIRLKVAKIMTPYIQILEDKAK